MATTEELLEMSTRGAVVRMVNDANKTNFHGGPGGALVISPPMAVGGVRTEVELSIRRQVNASEHMPYPGQLAFRYNRLDVGMTLYGELDGFRPRLPTSTQVLLDELTVRTGIKFELEDFVLEDILTSNAAPYVLKAKRDSLRWVGQLEVFLVDLINLGTYIPPGIPTQPQTLPLALPALQSRDVHPYLNATAHRAALAQVDLDTPVAVSGDRLVSFMRQTVGRLGEFLKDGTSPWVVSATPAPYNLHGARLLAHREPLEGLNAYVPAARYAARVELSSADTVYSGKVLLIPYGEPNLNDSQFNDMPRLKATAIINRSNGTAWNRWLNELPAPSIITSLPPGLDLRFSGPDRWVADPAVRSPTNLYNAVVQYNGPRRSFDIKPYHTECNRVLIVSMSEHNSAYQGNLTFHYRAPIIINDQLPDAYHSEIYGAPLSPREGVGPYTMRLVSGQLAPGHSLSADHRIVGTSTAAGSYNPVFEVEDAGGVKVRYPVSYRVARRDLVVSGLLPSAVRYGAYEARLQIQYNDGPCVVAVTSTSTLPPNTLVYVEGGEVVIRWPAWTAQTDPGVGTSVSLRLQVWDNINRTAVWVGMVQLQAGEV